jgi:hypothetical protein
MAGKKKKVVLDIFPYIWVSVSFCSLVERKKKTIADPRFRFLHTILQVCICCELISVLRSFPTFSSSQIMYSSRESSSSRVFSLLVVVVVYY